MSDAFSHVIHSNFWHEEAEPGNPFAAAVSRCSGYDVYGDLLGKAGYIEYLYLMIRRERPGRAQAAAFEVLAIALANPGPRDPSVHAASAAGVTGNPAANTLMAALASGGGSYGGGRAVLLAMQGWQECGQDLAAWTGVLQREQPQSRPLFWPRADAAPGFDPHGGDCPLPVRQTLATLAALLPDGPLGWLAANRAQLESAAGVPLAMSGVAACALFALGFNGVQAEMLTLLLRLPGAAAHALEQAELGFRHFPFFELELENDPAANTLMTKEAA